MNLLLSTLLVRLAASPQPLLRDYLLDPTLSLRPEYPSLFCTLEAVSRQAREEIRRVPQLPEWVQQHRATQQQQDSKDEARSPPPEPAGSPSNLRKFANLIRRNESSNTLDARKPSVVDPFEQASAVAAAQADSELSAAKQANRRTIVALLFLEEFVKELAALSMEQSFVALSDAEDVA